MSMRAPTVRFFGLATFLAFVGMLPGIAQGQPINVITVDCTPFVSPGFGQTTIGQQIQAVDPGGAFNVTEVDPPTFRLMSVADLSAFDLIAVNNNPSQIDCNGDGVGLGTAWHDAVGVDCGGRIALSSHDAPRFHANFTNCYFGGCIGPGVAPYGADDLVLQSALWAGGGSQTGLLIFNDALSFVGQRLGQP